ncbi:MAG: carbohydrate ABC transporter permease [Azospirillaceae bacterium]
MSRRRPQPWYTTRQGWTGAARLAGAIVVTIVFLFPIYWLFATAFKTPEEVFASPPVWFPQTPTLETFAVLFRDGDVSAVWNSIVIAGVSTVVAMFLGTIAAYSLARFRTGGDHLVIWIISQRMIPPIAVVFPIFLLFAGLGLIDTYLGLILLYTAFNLPYVIWMMRGYVEDVPRELEESALVDGLTRWQVLIKVVFPMARTGLFATAVFTFIFAWNEFIFALVLTRTEVLTFPVQVSHYFGQQQTFWAKIGAMSVLGALPVFVVVAMAQKLLVRGLSMGAVKG